MHIYFRHIILGCFLITILDSCAQSETKDQIVFFRSNAEGSKGHLFIMNADGSDQKQLGQSGSRPDHYPNWSPNGKQVTFESYRRGGWRIWIMDRDGSNARRLIPGGGGIQSYEFDPTFNASGEKVIYHGDVSKGSDLFQVDVASGLVDNLTRTDDLSEFAPDVSIRDDIVFTEADSGVLRIAKIDGKTGTRVRLTSGEFKDFAPTWSTDGAKILFYSDREGGFELFLMNADGSNPYRLITDAKLKEHGIKKGNFLPLDQGWNSCLQYRASFSSDDQWIAFSANTGESREIFKVKIKERIIKRLTNNKLHDGFPMFSPR